MNLNGVEYYYVRNGQGDIIALIDANGNEVVTYTYDSWGNIISINGCLKDTVGTKNPYRYRGYRYDEETKLYYLQSRYYNPEWGRFVNVDAIVGKTGELLGHNLFIYCKNNPVNAFDPSGFREIYTATLEEETAEMRHASLSIVKSMHLEQYKKELQHQFLTNIAIKINIATSMSGTVLSGVSKYYREWFQLGKGIEREFPYKSLGKFKYGAILTGVGFFTSEIAIELDPTYNAWQKEKLHQSNRIFTGIGIGVGLLVGLIPGPGWAIAAGVASTIILMGIQSYYENKYIN